jgi:RNA polymerase sigma factor (sigma-70 family)
MAPALRDVSVGEIERRLEDVREGEEPTQRTSVLTHMAWVPQEWARAADRVLEGLGARIPSRTILLHPDPKAKPDRIDAELDQEWFPGGEHDICAEIVRIWLRGRTAKAPASVVVPLQIPDLPVFLRWRGQPPFGTTELEQLVGVSDRLIVDSIEWPGLPRAFARLADTFERIAVSDLAWARTLWWRAGLADLWPGIKKARTLQVTGPRAEALLLRGWLRSRLRRDFRLRHEEASSLERVEVDGEPVEAARGLAMSPSDLLSDQLELFVRDPLYEPPSARCDDVVPRRRTSSVQALAEVPTFASVVERHLDDVHGYLVYLTRDRGIAEDLTAETFEKALRMWRRFDPRRGSARTWLCQLARTTALDHFRAEDRRRRREGVYAIGEHVEPEEGLFGGLSPELERALAALSAGEREVIALRVLLDLDGETAARVLGISVTACSTRLSRALKKLEERMSADVAA